MCHKPMMTGLILLLVLLLGVAGATAQEPEDDIGALAEVGTAITYQGRLSDGGGPINDDCDLRFRLYDEAGSGDPPIGGSQVGADVERTVTLDDGYFTVADLDFGPNAFNGEARWLEIRVNCGSGDVDLSPRQSLTAAPYAQP